MQNSHDYRAERGGWEETIRFCEDPSLCFQGDFFREALSGFAGDRVCLGEEVTKVVRNKPKTLHLSGECTLWRTLLNLSLGLAVLAGATTAVHAQHGHGGGHGGGAMPY